MWVVGVCIPDICRWAIFPTPVQYTIFQICGLAWHPSLKDHLLMPYRRPVSLAVGGKVGQSSKLLQCFCKIAPSTNEVHNSPTALDFRFIFSVDNFASSPDLKLEFEIALQSGLVPTKGEGLPEKFSLTFLSFPLSSRKSGW